MAELNASFTLVVLCSLLTAHGIIVTSARNANSNASLWRTARAAKDALTLGRRVPTQRQAATAGALTRTGGNRSEWCYEPKYSRCFTHLLDDNSDNRAVSDEVKDLRRLVGDLVGTVGELKTQLNQQIVFSPSRPDHISVDSQPTRINEASSIRGSRHLSTQDVSVSSPLESSPQHIGVPKQPQFVGPTRSAFSIAIGEEALTQRGIPEFNPPPPSGVQSPVGSPKQGPTTLDAAFWQRCGTDEIVRLITVFQEEVESVYPCTDTDYLAGAASDIVTWGRAPEDADPSTLTPLETLTFKDFQIAKVAIATAIVIEAHGKTENSTMMVDSVERNVSRILKPASDLKDLQLLTILVSRIFSSITVTFL